MKCSICKEKEAEWKSVGIMKHIYPVLCDECLTKICKGVCEKTEYHERIGVHKEQATAEVLV